MSQTEQAPPAARPPRPVTVVIAHHDDDARAPLVRWLSADPRIAVVGETSDAATLVEATMRTNPSVALVDIDLPDDTPGRAGGTATGEGIAAIATLAERRPATRLVLITDEDDDRSYAAVAAGAVGCYLMPSPLSPLTDVVVGVARGEGALTTGWAGRLIDEIGWLNREPMGLRAPELSPTELEVIRRISSGATPAAIAALHAVTEHVVNVNAGSVVTKVYRHHDDMRRLGVAS
jgi:DNA-binding NarL/FixJ family response regulator